MYDLEIASLGPIPVFAIAIFIYHITSEKMHEKFIKMKKYIKKTFAIEQLSTPIKYSEL